MALSRLDDYIGPKYREVNIYFVAQPSILPDAEKLLSAVINIPLRHFDIKSLNTP